MVNIQKKLHLAFYIIDQTSDFPVIDSNFIFPFQDACYRFRPPARPFLPSCLFTYTTHRSIDCFSNVTYFMPWIFTYWTTSAKLR